MSECGRPGVTPPPHAETAGLEQRRWRRSVPGSVCQQRAAAAAGWTQSLTRLLPGGPRNHASVRQHWAHGACAPRRTAKAHIVAAQEGCGTATGNRASGHKRASCHKLWSSVPRRTSTPAAPRGSCLRAYCPLSKRRRRLALCCDLASAEGVESRPQGSGRRDGSASRAANAAAGGMRAQRGHRGDTAATDLSVPSCWR